MDWNRLKIFFYVAKAGSFTQAAVNLNITQSALSRTILNLENDLKTELFHRTPKGVSLTNEGKIWFNTASKIYREIEESQMLNLRTDPTKDQILRVSTTRGLASCWLTYMIEDFIKQKPSLDLEIIGCDQDLDLISTQVDTAILPFKRTREGLIQDFLMELHFSLYASPDYLKKYGTPQKLTDLNEHQIITLGNTVPHQWSDFGWPLNAGKKPGEFHRSTLKANSSHSLIYLAQRGLGITSFADNSRALENSGLVRLCEGEGVSVDYYYIYPETFKNSELVIEFRDYLLNKINNHE